MSKKVNERDRWPVPDDWNEQDDGYSCVLLCIPNSRGWRTIFTGQISDMAYGRNWNRHSGTITEAQSVARDIFESMCIMKCEDLIKQLTIIAQGVVELNGTIATQGGEIEPAPSDGDFTVGPEEQFPDQEAYFDAKCNVANSIYDTIFEFMTWMVANSADLKVGVFGGVTSGLLVALAVSGPAGWAIGAASGLVTSLAGFIISEVISFTDLSNALIDRHDECVTALYNASDVGVAEDNFITELKGGIFPITPVEESFVRLLLTFDLLNNLFDPREDLATYQSPSPITCGTTLALWTFPTDAQGWTFRDDSTANASAVGSYDSTNEALSHEQIIQAGGSFRMSRAVDVSPAISIAVTPINAISADFDATSDGEVVWRTLTAFYSDLTTEDTTLGAHSGAGTIILNLTQSKTLVKIELETGRSNGATTQGFEFTTKTLEVRVT